MLFSLKNHLNINKSDINENTNCLIISSSYQTTHIVPILQGRINLDKTRRIGVGGYHANELLTKSFHLKYPDLRPKFTNEVVQEIQEKYTMCAKNYHSQLGLLENVFKYDQEKLKEEERKRMFGSLEMYNKAYAKENEKINLLEKKYKHLKTYKNSVEYNNEILGLDEDGPDLINDLIFLEWPHAGNEIVLTEEELKKKQEIRKEQSKRLREIMQKKREENFRNLEKEIEELERISQMKDSDKYHFEEAILNKGFTNADELHKRIHKIYTKLNFDKEGKEEEKFDEEKRWPFLNIPDEDLTEDQIKMKRIQKMQRNAYLSRLEKREIIKKEKEKIEEFKQKSPETFLISLYRKKKELIDRLENYKQIRKDLTSRRSGMNQKRMMVLAELGRDNEQKGKKKNENAKDDFGMNDEDWEVYRGISRHNLSEDEEEDQQQLNEVEAQIIEIDPNYFKYNESLAQGFMYGSHHFGLGVDQFRGAELIFKPYLIGIEQAGLIEIILSVFKTMSYDERRKLAGNVYLTVKLFLIYSFREAMLK